MESTWLTGNSASHWKIEVSVVLATLFLAFSSVWAQSFPQSGQGGLLQLTDIGQERELTAKRTGPSSRDSAETAMDLAPAHGPGKRLLFISSAIQDAGTLARVTEKNVSVIRYTPRTTSMAELVAKAREILAGERAISIGFAVHDHGENRFYLTASETVSLGSSLSQEGQRRFWRDMGALVEENGRIDLLACKLAAGNQGKLLMAALEAASGRRMAASENTTGNMAAGGDWFLEVGGIDVANLYFIPNQLPLYNGLLLSQVQKLTDDTETSDLFGYSVSLDGERAMVGAIYADPGGLNNKGAVYVFDLEDGTWTQTATLSADDGEANDNFGNSVSLHGDRALVGAFRAESNKGTAYIYSLSGDTWVQTAKLTANDGVNGDFFGYSVSLDGDRALVGANQAAIGGQLFRGASYVFDFSGGTWVQTAKLIAHDGAASDNFGISTSLRGERALVGAYYDESGIGAAYVFERTGSLWTQTAKLTADDGTPGDRFGCSVSQDGDRILIGAYGDESLKGAAYIFELAGSTWTQTAKLSPLNGIADDLFGHSVALSGDQALIGAKATDREGIVDQGAAYLYDLSGSTWIQTAELIANDGAVADNFGTSVSLDGNRAVIGAVSMSSPSGAAYVFQPDSSSIPMVTTQAVSDIKSTTATGSGNITDLGSPNPMAHGVCWSTSTNPSLSDTCTDNGPASVTGLFTVNMTGLSPKTTYHVRAFATNTSGTGYGEEGTFTTSEAKGTFYILPNDKGSATAIYLE